MPRYAHVKNWRQFQHYKDRSPPWIKLQRSLLDDYEFQCLPIASKAIAPCIWLLASESEDGSVRIDVDWLAFRLRMDRGDVDDGLIPLIEHGFLVPCSDDASAALAESQQDACLEGEGETEGEKRTRCNGTASFDAFWTAYPSKKGKKPARDKWKQKGLDAKADTIIADVQDRAKRDKQWLDGYIPNPATYLNQERWEDEWEPANQKSEEVIH